MTKLEALAKFLECELDELSDCDGETFDYRNGRKSYLVLTDEEADRKAKEYILDSGWAFNPSFLEAHAIDGVDEEVFKAIQENGRCEDNNNAILALLKDEDHFVKDAILSDGRGHFMSSYDGEEHEAGEFYIYRTN